VGWLRETDSNIFSEEKEVRIDRGVAEILVIKTRD
jgi:hypothetical protein